MDNRSPLALPLLVGGLVGWAALMIYIVSQNMTNGSKPSPLVIGLTVFCWVVFFIGKTLNKSKGPNAEDAHGS